MPNLLWDACHFGCITRLGKKRKKFQWTMATQGLHSINSFENIVIHTTRCLKQNFFGVQNFTKMRKKKGGGVYFVTRLSVFEKILPNFEKKIKNSFSPHVESNFSLVAFF